MATNDLRRFINNQFSMRGLSLDGKALTYLTSQLEGMSKELRQNTITQVMRLVEDKGGSCDLLSMDKLTEILKTVSRQKKNESEVNFKVENAFEWRKQLASNKRREVLLGNHSSPLNMLSYDSYLQRFGLVKTLLEEELRNKFVHIDSLLARRGTKVCLLAKLCRGNTNGFMAEDQTGTVELDLSIAQYQPGIYFEGGIFQFEGVCSSTGNVLQVERVNLPQLTPIAETDEQEPIKRKDPNDRIVFLSDVLLDNPSVMRAVYEILKGFSRNPPDLFIFCGRFLTVQVAHGYTEQSSTAFRHLANMLAEFAIYYPTTQFVLVPSPEDPPPLAVFPCPPLPPNVQECFKNVRNVHFTTNPCRLIFKDQCILICRDDLVEKLCRSAIHMPKDVTASTIPKLFCKTIWSQRHLSPLPLFYSPINPHFDPLFQLWPAPDVLVIADKYKAFIEQADEKSRLTINPGPFSGGSFEFMVYYPTLRKADTHIPELLEEQ